MAQKEIPAELSQPPFNCDSYIKCLTQECRRSHCMHCFARIDPKTCSICLFCCMFFYCNEACCTADRRRVHLQECSLLLDLGHFRTLCERRDNLCDLRLFLLRMHSTINLQNLIWETYVSKTVENPKTLRQFLEMQSTNVDTEIQHLCEILANHTTYVNIRKKTYPKRLIQMVGVIRRTRFRIEDRASGQLLGWGVPIVPQNEHDKDSLAIAEMRGLRLGPLQPFPVPVVNPPVQESFNGYVNANP